MVVRRELVFHRYCFVMLVTVSSTEEKLTLFSVSSTQEMGPSLQTALFSILFCSGCANVSYRKGYIVFLSSVRE